MEHFNERIDGGMWKICMMEGAKILVFCFSGYGLTGSEKWKENSALHIILLHRKNSRHKFSVFPSRAR
jgi:hypothetical protein